MTFISSLYDFPKDQGNMIAGTLALVAGFAAYRAGQNQAKATREQSFQNIRTEKRKIALESIKASIIMKGIIKTVSTIIDYDAPTKSLSAPLISVLPYLSAMSRDFCCRICQLFCIIGELSSA